MAIVTITTNLNNIDAYLGALKGTILSFQENAIIIDLGIGLNNFDIKQAAMAVRSTWKTFPNNTIHLIHQNFPDKNSKIAIAKHQNHFFVAFNNGVIPLLLGEQPEESYLVAFQERASDCLYLNEIGYIIDALIQNKPLHSIGEKNTLAYLTLLPCIINNGVIEGSVMYIDTFKNLITNISKTDFSKTIADSPFKISFLGGDLDTIHTAYNDVQSGDFVAIFNMNNYLEIAINQGKIADWHGIKPGSRVTINKI